MLNLGVDYFDGLSDDQQELMLMQACPDYWLEKTTGESPWTKQVEIMQSVAVNARVAVASGNSIGKTFIAARIACWFMDCFYPATVITTAPTTRQVKDLLWKEMSVVHARAKRNGRPLGGELFTTNWNFPGSDGKHFATGFAPKDYDANRFIGYHNDNIMVIEDEAAGITEAVNEGVNSIVKGGHTRWLKIGNPTNIEGPFYAAFRSPDWQCYHISEFDSPNVDAVPPPKVHNQDIRVREQIMRKFLDSLQSKPVKVPGLVIAADILKDFNAWGEDHPLWQARVLGQFPDRTGDTFIALSWVERAEKSERRMEGVTIDIGVDVARYGSANTVLVAKIGDRPGQGNAFGAEVHGQQSTMVTCGRIVTFVRKIRSLWGQIAPPNLPCPKIRLKVDAVGLGAGVVDRCREIFGQDEWLVDGRKRILVYEMIEHATARDPIQYANASTEWWAVAGKGFEAGDIAGEIFSDKRLMAELVSRKYKYGSDGRMKAESKEDMKSRGEASPDFGDAVVLAFCEVPMQIEDEDSSGIHAGQIYGR